VEAAEIDAWHELARITKEAGVFVSQEKKKRKLNPSGGTWFKKVFVRNITRHAVPMNDSQRKRGKKEKKKDFSCCWRCPARRRN
jgi:hypothetical protein